MASLTLDGKGQYLARTEDLGSSGAYNTDVYNEGIYNFPLNLRVGDAWTLGFWAKPGANKEHGTIFSVGNRDGKNEIRVSTTAIPIESIVHGKRPAELRVLIKDFEGTAIKQYGWGDWFQSEVWTHTFLQWNGVELNAYKNAFLTTTGVVFVDVSGTMGDSPARKIFYGSAVAGNFATFSGIMGHFGMWDELLDPIELRTVVSGGFSTDLTVASGSYTSQGNLQHYWKPGEDLTNLGKDFTTSGTRLDLTKQRNITTDNVTSESPWQDV